MILKMIWANTHWMFIGHFTRHFKNVTLFCFSVSLETYSDIWNPDKNTFKLLYSPEKHYFFLYAKYCSKPKQWGSFCSWHHFYWWLYTENHLYPESRRKNCPLKKACFNLFIFPLAFGENNDFYLTWIGSGELRFLGFPVVNWLFLSFPVTHPSIFFWLPHLFDKSPI